MEVVGHDFAEGNGRGAGGVDLLGVDHVDARWVEEQKLAEEGVLDGKRLLDGLCDQRRVGDERDARAVGVGGHHGLLHDGALQRDAAAHAGLAERGLYELGGLLDDDGVVGACFESWVEVDGAVGADHEGLGGDGGVSCEDASEGAGRGEKVSEESERRRATAIGERRGAFHDGRGVWGDEILRLAAAREEACAQRGRGDFNRNWTISRQRR